MLERWRDEHMDLEALRRALLRRPETLAGIAGRLNISTGQALDAIEALREQGALLVEMGGAWSVQRTPNMGDKVHLRKSDARGWHRFGVISDTHYGSKYAREDVCDDLYDWYAKEGVSTVYHCGNWVEGQAPFNKYELVEEAHGMQAQIDYFVARYPQRRGVQTHYVAGDDHEGWWTQREGVDVGPLLENTARKAGRTDLKYLGYKEAFLTLEHARSGKHARVLVDHPGGGSAYADSYAAQKRIEAAQPGEKPAMWLFGHWHKIGIFYPRGVIAVLAGCTKDLDTFGRKKGLRYDVGGWIIEVRQDERGGLVECVPRVRTYFDRGYYARQYGLERTVRK
jgi:hypothetical protein